jgi:hypothetical protein
MNPRAWASLFALVAAIGLALVLALMPRADRPETDSMCRTQVPRPGAALACLDGQVSDVMSAELAGNAERWRCVVRRTATTAVSAAVAVDCAEQRTQRLRDAVRGFDQGLFMPLYAALSALLAAWAWSHARLCVQPPPRRLRAAAVVLVASTLALLAADLWENAQVLALLDLLDRDGVAAAPLALDAPALHARQVSALKWLACVPWALSLAAVMHAVLCWPAAAPRPWRWLRHASVALTLGAAAAMALAAVAALGGDGLRLPVTALRLGSGALIGALAGAGVAAAWGALKRGIACA